MKKKNNDLMNAIKSGMNDLKEKNEKDLNGIKVLVFFEKNIEEKYLCKFIGKIQQLIRKRSQKNN